MLANPAVILAHGGHGDEFHQENSDRSRSSGGSGLGLAIARAIVQANQGNLNVQSELSKGSTFTVQLPFDVAPLNSIRSQFKSFIGNRHLV
ncbi:MAG: hypothetical protein KME54_05860 [Tolypothrix brevis GSE-NOS-MK-07-07A]|nr:hypothetical protein [Tolypothrix brevis GSE-NOS-MK-07-07A]